MNKKKITEKLVRANLWIKPIQKKNLEKRAKIRGISESETLREILTKEFSK